MISENIKKIISTFKGDGINGKKCGEMYCTTCGGYMSGLGNRIDKELLLLIKDTLSKISMSDLDEFGEWKSVLLRVDELGVISVYIREADKLDSDDIRKLDKFLFSAREVYALNNREFELIYQPFIEKAINLALDKMDNSLVETLVLILKRSLVKHTKLLNLAIKMSETDTQMRRVLYNCLRDIVPEVRGYHGYRW